MSVSENQIKEIVKKGLLDILNSYDFTRQKLSDNAVCQQASDPSNRTLKHLSKSIKTFVELSLTNDIECLFGEISNVNKETWKIDAHHLAKVILDESKVTCVQDNLNNIIDSCMNKAKHQSNSKQLNDSEIDISPLLQPEHVSEIADCMSAENPLDIRLNALRVLLKSHISEVGNGETWILLQKKLVDNLCDSNIDVFVVCLKVHAKLGTCSSPLAVKECSLNILDSLGRHYLLQHSESKVITLQSIYFYRMVYLTRLLLDTFREATMSVARFGESKLDEMIDNFIHLMTIHVPSKISRNKPCLSPLEVVSYLDPEANWLKNLIHFSLTRKLVFSCLSKSSTFLRISVEEILHWTKEPVIPSKCTSKVSLGEINIVVHKFSLFCHSLSVISSICSFRDSHTLFPLRISKQEDLMGFETLLEMLIVSLNNQRFIDMMNTQASEFFVNLFTFSLVKLLSTNSVDSNSLLLLLLSSRDDKNPLENPIKLKIFNTMYLNSELLGSGLVSKRKQSLFSSFSKSKLNEPVGNIQQKWDIEHQSSMRISMDNDNKDFLLSEVFLKHIRDKLGSSVINGIPQLLNISSHIFRRFDGVAVINYPYIVQILNIVCKMYTRLIDSFKNVGTKNKNDDILLNESCEQFLLQAATSSLGFHHLYKNGVVASLFLNKVQHPVTNWSDNVYLMFLSKAASSDEGSRSLCKESSGVLRNHFDKLWSSLEDDCSGSELPVNEAANSLYRVVAYLCISLNGLKALTSDSNEGSEITLTDDCDIKPTNLCLLIQNLALNTSNSLDYTHHEIALTVLEILVSNIDSSLYLQHKFKFQDILLQFQSDNRVDENSGVIIDECSILRQRIIDRAYLPYRFRLQTVPSHTAPRPESTIICLSRTRSRGSGDLSRWLSETRLGLHDNNWLKHVRKLYKNSSPDEIKGSVIIDLLEQVVKVMPENRVTIKWQSHISEDLRLEPEELLGIQLVVRYGTHLRLIQSSQQTFDNLKRLIQLVKASINHDAKEFEGFDWFVASVYIVCSGNIEKSQAFLSLISCLPNGPLMWYRIRNNYVYAQLGNALEMIISEEMPSLSQVLLREGLSWWNLCSLWISQCWWNVLEWSHICHWLVISILYQTDRIIYFCVAILHTNHDRILQLARQGTIYEIIVNPVEKINFLEAKYLMEKLHKKYHISIQHYFTSF